MSENDTTATMDATDEWSTIDPVEWVNDTQQVELHYAADVSMLPAPVRNYLVTVARDIEREFRNVLAADDTDTSDTIDEILPRREKVILHTVVPFDADQSQRDAVVQIANGYEQRFRLAVLRLREKHTEYEPPTEIADPNDVPYSFD